MSFKLKAVNRCLRAIGETPVNSLASGVPDAEDALAIIDETTETVLSMGWHSNTSYGVKFYPNADKQIIIPHNVLRIDSSGSSSHINVTAREDINDFQKKLFNVDEQTFIFDNPVDCDVVYYYDIDGLPYALQDYIACVAAVRFQESAMSSQSLDAFAKRAELEAWNRLLDAELEAEDANVLKDSPDVRRIVRRNAYF